MSSFDMTLKDLNKRAREMYENEGGLKDDDFRYVLLMNQLETNKLLKELMLTIKSELMTGLSKIAQNSDPHFQDFRYKQGK